jgi:hypothetical protein
VSLCSCSCSLSCFSCRCVFRHGCAHQTCCESHGEVGPCRHCAGFLAAGIEEYEALFMAAAFIGSNVVGNWVSGAPRPRVPRPFMQSGHICSKWPWPHKQTYCPGTHLNLCRGLPQKAAVVLGDFDNLPPEELILHVGLLLGVVFGEPIRPHYNYVPSHLHAPYMYIMGLTLRPTRSASQAYTCWCKGKTVRTRARNLYIKYMCRRSSAAILNGRPC